jgi:hypothetical protein
MYSVAGRPKGSDRSSDFTVSSYVRMTFNKPLHRTARLSARGAPTLTYAGTGGYANDPPPPVNIYGQQGTFIGPSAVYYGPPLPQYGSSFQNIDFLSGRVLGNLGQAVFFQVVFVGGDARSRFLDIDVTFRGALLSSDPV